MLDDSVLAGPIRVLLLSGEYRTARTIEELLHTAWSRSQLITHATWDPAAAEALLGHPGCCVLVDASIDDYASVLEYVRMSAPEVPIVVLSAEHDEALAARAIQDGAQDCLVSSELDPALLRRALAHAIERKRAEDELVHQALHDPLTGLPNRALFLDRLGLALERSRRSGEPLAVLFLDFDNFKQVNDARGHAAGDRLLATLGDRLSGLLRPMDTIARFGGDEFTLLFEGLTSEREVVLIAERICQAAALPVDLDGSEVRVSVSVGISLVSDPDIWPETIIREADAAMYRAKEQGRSRYELFDEESRRRAEDRIELEAAIRRAVEEGELRVHYQPSLGLDALGEVSGVEALVRWQHPVRGIIAAREFMPLAADIGLLLPIGRFVLEHSLLQLAQWRARRPDVTISLNLSAAQLLDPALPATLEQAIRAGELDPAAICLEVAERELADDPDASISALEKLKATGVRIAIDDFGTGAFALSTLCELPIDALKIDQSFIAGLGVAPEDGALIGALVALGHALGCSVVAEGVETEGQLEQLRELGCDAAQGYAIGRPVSGEELEGLLPAAVV